MEDIGQYILSVACAALACAMASNMVQGDSAVTTLTKTVAGLVLTFTLLQPLTKGTFQFSVQGFGHILDDAQAVVSQGEKERILALQQVIKAETETYIRDKAQSMGAEVTACITISEEAMPVPVSVQLSGTVSPYARMKLENLITEELGIAKENLSWT